MGDRLTRGIVLLAANAIGLLVASIALDKLVLGWRTFIIAVGIFTVIEVLAQPLIERGIKSKAEAFLGGAALLSTFVGLLVTALISDGIKITGVSTWALATVIVWVAALAAGAVLPVVLRRLGGAADS